MLATGGGQTLLYRPGAVHVWAVDDGKSLAKLDGHKTTVWAVAFSPDGRTLVTTGYDSTVKLWNVADGKEIATLAGHKNWVLDAVFSPDGKLVATASEALLPRA